MKKIVFVFVFCFLAGCATFSSQMYPNAKKYPATNPEDIAIFEFPPQEPFVAIGEVGSQAAPAAQRESLYKRLKEEASKMGGDAIIVNHSKDVAGFYNSGGSSYTSGTVYGYGNTATYSGTTTTYPTYSTPIVKKIIRGLVIKYVDESEVPKQKLEVEIEEDGYDKLKKLKELKDDGAITEEEFNKEKKEILEKY
ncbi:MAG: SHOCT domain-containing protein [Candidatus Omnitrophica bacterium]|nr:SHOCT domain-containing protein [Candidatus Omnitrophota bacterium]